MRYRIELIIVLVLVVFASTAHAQGLSSILGTVTDPSGAVVPGAHVTVAQEGTGFTRTVDTDSQGNYVLPSLRPSNYTLTVELSGFRKSTRTGITLLADQSLTVNMKLELGQESQVITVQEATPQVDTYTATLKEVVDEKRMVELPLNGRNAALLTTLVAGVVQDRGDGEDADEGPSKTFPTVAVISTNGSRQNQVNFLLDGGNNTDQFTNVNMPFPFPDALQEFSVQTSNYSAKYGQNAGGVVNIVTKSGTNDLHGNVFEFARNSVFNARNFFESSRDQLKRNQFGGTVGGPVVLPHLYNGKDRTYFFAGYQGTEMRNTYGTNSAFVPTAANLAGDFSALLNADDPNNPVGSAKQLVDPFTGQPFPGNRIDPARFDPASVVVATQYLPSATGNGLTFYPARAYRSYSEVLGRFDHTIKPTDHFFYRFFIDRFEKKVFLDPKNLLTDDTGSRILSQSYLLNETHTFRPNLLNDFNFTYTRLHASRSPAPGTPKVSDFGVNIYQPPGLLGINALYIEGYFGIENDMPASFVRNSFNWSDDVSWVRGQHNLGFGGQFSRTQLDINNLFRTAGNFDFTGDATGDSMADFLLGRLRTFTQGNGQYGRSRNSFTGLYVQDTFRVNKRLSLDFGLRWDPWFQLHEKNGRVLQFRPDAYAQGLRTQVYVNALPGEFFPGDPSFPKDGLNNSLNQVAPRMGFAYDLFGDSKPASGAGPGFFTTTARS